MNYRGQIRAEDDWLSNSTSSLFLLDTRYQEWWWEDHRGRDTSWQESWYDYPFLGRRKHSNMAWSMLRELWQGFTKCLSFNIKTFWLILLCDMIRKKGNIDKPESELPSPKPKSESKIWVQSPRCKFSDWGCHNNHMGHHPPHPTPNF